MYERSAIVLERYLQTTLGYRKRSNIKSNYKNYCKLIEDVEKYQEACIREKEAVKDFNSTTEELSEIQKKQEKLYKRDAKLEYSRNIIFNNIETDPEETENCIIKIESSIEKIKTEMVELRKSFIDKICDYAIRKQHMQECKQEKKEAEAEYKETLRVTIENKQKIDPENVEFVRAFVEKENEDCKKELIQVMKENGEGEKNPFDTDIIENAAVLGMDIAKKEAECYLFIFDKTEKLLSDIEKRLIEINRFKRWARDIGVKLDFLMAEKDYLVQFLDYERITVIHPKRTHKKLMQEACKNLADDVVQINNLFELILKEIAGKSTKKGYKQLYNKSYLLEMEQTEVDFQKEKDKININAGTLINSNYWRIEGIKNIYTVFYKNVSEVYGKDLVEFDLPKTEEIEEAEKNNTTTESEEKIVKTSKEEVVENAKKDPVDLIFETTQDESKEEAKVQEEEEDELTFIDSEEENIYEDESEEDLEESDSEEENNEDTEIVEEEAKVEVEENKNDDNNSSNNTNNESDQEESEDGDYEDYTYDDEYDDYEDYEDEYDYDDYDDYEEDEENVSAFEDNDEEYDNYITDFNDSEESLWDATIDFENNTKTKEKNFGEGNVAKKGGFFKKLSTLNKKKKNEAM